MKQAKETTPSAEEPQRPKRKRERKRDRARPTKAVSPVESAEKAGQRIDVLLAQVRDRSAKLVEATRERPSRWDYFAALVAIEETLREVLS